MRLCAISVDFYPRPPRGGRQLLQGFQHPHIPISIHALREEGDRNPWKSLTFPRYFYPRPPRGGRPKFKYPKQPDLEISIHALREEGDNVPREWIERVVVFLSTPSARRATEDLVEAGRISQISIHALREEGDAAYRDDGHGHRNFYPRPPRGGRLQFRQAYSDAGLFLSTPSARRATPMMTTSTRMQPRFLSTPSARRATRADVGHRLSEGRFLSTPSARRATDNSASFLPGEGFLSTPSARRATSRAARTDGILHDFYPRPPRGGRQKSRSPPPAAR